MLVLLVTGLLEVFYYIPTPEQAGMSIQTLTFLVPTADWCATCITGRRNSW